MGLSISLTYNAIDKGENALSVLRREEYPTIIGLKLGDARKALADGIRKTRDMLKILDLDKKLQELDVADAQDYVALLEKLFNGGLCQRGGFGDRPDRPFPWRNSRLRGSPTTFSSRR